MRGKYLGKARIAVLCYNFPHKKTQDFLVRLFLEGYRIELVIASDPVKLKIPPPSIRTKLRHSALLDPKLVAERIGARYHVFSHNSPQAVELVRTSGIDLGIIAGARILKKPIIDAFKRDIINFHPGLIPEARGLDAMLWSIYRDISLGVTAHLIDERIDAGNILIKQCIPLYPDDTLLGLSERLYETQLDMLKPAIEKALKGEGIRVDYTTSSYNSKMPADLEKIVLKKLPEYLLRMAKSSPEGEIKW
ncbi:MAG: formyltransferase family protein [Actinomycetota bacterium]|nr:formyltransferase family protein [Actinomycetota bacterium]